MHDKWRKSMWIGIMSLVLTLIGVQVGGGALFGAGQIQMIYYNQTEDWNWAWFLQNGILKRQSEGKMISLEYRIIAFNWAYNITWLWWMVKDRSYVHFLNEGNEPWNRWGIKYWDLGDHLRRSRSIFNINAKG